MREELNRLKKLLWPDNDGKQQPPSQPEPWRILENRGGDFLARGYLPPFSLGNPDGTRSITRIHELRCTRIKPGISTRAEYQANERDRSLVEQAIKNERRSREAAPWRLLVLGYPRTHTIYFGSRVISTGAESVLIHWDLSLTADILNPHIEIDDAALWICQSLFLLAKDASMDLLLSTPTAAHYWHLAIARKYLLHLR